MVTLRLPDDTRSDLKERLYDEHRVEIPVFERGSARYMRASFQGYNDDADMDTLARALAAEL